MIPKRHFPTWFEAAPHEQATLTKGIEKAKQTIEAHHRPDGYNSGINVGAAGGQTVPHLHIAVSPAIPATSPPFAAAFGT